jgi:hypothetical protein
LTQVPEAIRRLLGDIEHYWRVPPGTPDWERAIVLYGTLTVSLVLVSILLDCILSGINTGVEKLLRTLGNASSERIAEVLAALYVRAEAALMAARRLTNAPIGYAPEIAQSNVLRFVPLGRRFIAGPLIAFGAFFYLCVGLVAGAGRRTLENALTWLVIAWYLGWLSPLVRHVSQISWRSIQPSQLAAALGLVVVLWALVGRADVRGRVEFNKTTSVEIRKRLLGMRVHLAYLLSAQNRVRADVTNRLRTFPSSQELEDLTGVHGLTWKRRRVAAEETCHRHVEDPYHVLGRRRNLVPSSGGQGARVRAAMEADDEQTAQHHRAIVQAVSELKELGYYPRALRILPPRAGRALFPLSLSRMAIDFSRCASVRLIEDSLKPDSADYILRGLWRAADKAPSLKRARKATGHLIWKAVQEVRDGLWDGYVESARLNILMRAIQEKQQEQLVDRLKQ